MKYYCTVQCRLTAGIPTILLEQKVLGQDNSTSIVIHTTCTSDIIHILSTYSLLRPLRPDGSAMQAARGYYESKYYVA